MNDDINGSDNMQSGSPESMDTDPTLEGGVGQSEDANAQELIGRQGKELGDYRSFFEEISPLLERLDADPELTRAILDGKVSSQMLKPVSEGEIPLKVATDVTKAHEEIKKELGKSTYEKLSPQQLEDRIMKKFEKRLDDFQNNVTTKLSEDKTLRELEDATSEFINSTPDFGKYADAIDTWFDEHPNITDIDVAYDAVRGKALSQERAEQSQVDTAQKAKELAGNAGGGTGQSTGYFDNREMVDKLIAGRSSPNIF